MKYITLTLLTLTIIGVASTAVMAQGKGGGNSDMLKKRQQIHKEQSQQNQEQRKLQNQQKWETRKEMRQQHQEQMREWNQDRKCWAIDGECVPSQRFMHDYKWRYND